MAFSRGFALASRRGLGGHAEPAHGSGGRGCEYWEYWECWRGEGERRETRDEKLGAAALVIRNFVIRNCRRLRRLALRVGAAEPPRWAFGGRSNTAPWTRRASLTPVGRTRVLSARRVLSPASSMARHSLCFAIRQMPTLSHISRRVFVALSCAALRLPCSRSVRSAWRATAPGSWRRGGDPPCAASLRHASVSAHAPPHVALLMAARHRRALRRPLPRVAGEARLDGRACVACCAGGAAVPPRWTFGGRSNACHKRAWRRPVSLCMF